MLGELFFKPSPVGSEDPRLDLSALWGGIGLGSNIFSRPLTIIAKVSPSFVNSHAKYLLRSLTPTARR